MKLREPLLVSFVPFALSVLATRFGVRVYVCRGGTALAFLFRSFTCGELPIDFYFLWCWGFGFPLLQHFAQ